MTAEMINYDNLSSLCFTHKKEHAEMVFGAVTYATQFLLHSLHKQQSNVEKKIK